MFINNCKYKWETLRLAATAEATAITAFHWSDNWPSSGVVNVTEKFPDANAIRVVFYGSDADNEDSLYRILGRHPQNGPILTMLAGEVTLGAAACAKDPVSDAALTNHFWGDTITVTGGSQQGCEVINDAADKIAAVDIPLKGVKEVFMEIDLDGGDGTAMAKLGAIITGITMLGA
jgi:hypothetical protein